MNVSHTIYYKVIFKTDLSVTPAVTDSQCPGMKGRIEESRLTFYKSAR